MRLMKNRRGMQLSVNFVVMLILAITIFAFGIAFLNKLFPRVHEYRGYLDEQTEAQLESLLSQGQRVAIPITNKRIKAGDAAVFGVGLLNIDPEDTHFYFRITVENGYAFDSNEEQIANSFHAPLYTPEHELKNNQNKKITVVLPSAKNTRKGTYVFNVYVCRQESSFENCHADSKYTPSDGPEKPNHYDRVRKLYVEVI